MTRLVLMTVLLLALVAAGCREPAAAEELPAAAPSTRPADAAQPAAMAEPPPEEGEVPTTRPATQPSGKATLDDALALLAARGDWDNRPPLTPDMLPRHPAEKFLKGMTIVLDPGHGGDAHHKGYKVGPTGVREAEMNFRVGVLLKQMLETAGATVIMTRDGDFDLSLRDRAEIANRANADLFLSLHHNAAESPTTNWPSVWYHGLVDDAGPELDAARYIGHALGRHMRSLVAVTSTLMSDRQMFRSGFGVLRHTTVPAVLLESSFFTHPGEEQRLDDAVYNLREAYAIYEGLCEWAYGGRPTQEVTVDGSTLTATLTHGLPKWWGDDLGRTVPDSVTVRLGDTVVAHAYDRPSRTLTAELPELKAGDVLTIYHENVFGHRNWPRRYAVEPPSSATQPTLMTLRPQPPVRAGSPAESTDPDRPWLALGKTDDAPLLLHGGSVESQQVLDAIELPEGSALTVARVDPSGDVLYAMRWRDSGTRGFYPASTVKLITAIQLLPMLNALDPETPFDTWHVQMPGDKLAGDKAMNVAELMRIMIADSDNDAFNTLQELVGFAETQAFLQGLGVEKLIVRRHFTRPHWNNSKEATLTRAGKEPITVPARPGPELPLNADPRHVAAGGGESNWASTDDFVRVLAATFLTDTRELPGFEVLAEAMAKTNEPFVGSGAKRAMPEARVYNKPGWWPGDGANSDLAYVYDPSNDRHYFVGVYYQSPRVEGDPPPTEAREGIARAAEALFAAIRDGRIRL